MLGKKAERCLLVVILFMMIYNPPIGRIKSLLVLAPFSVIYIIFNYRYILMNFKSVITGYFVWTLLLFYILLVAVLNNKPPENVRSYIYILVSVIPTSMMITSIIKKRGNDLFYYIDTILYAGLIQCFLSFAAFFSGSIKNFFVNLMINGRVFAEDTYGEYMASLRLFGFSTGLTFGMPVVQGFLAVLALYFAINRKHSLKYYLMVVLFAFSGVINARSTIVVLGLGSAIALLTFQQNDIGIVMNRILKILGVAILALILISFGLSILKKTSYNTFVWFEEGIEQIKMFFYGDTSSGYFSYIADSERWKLPSGLNLLFGMNRRVLGAEDFSVMSDIGYVNDIYFGGLFYAVILYTMMVKYIIQLRRSREYNGFGKFLSIVFFCLFIILNFKVYVFDLNNFFVLFVMIAVYISRKNKSGKINFVGDLMQ